VGQYPRRVEDLFRHLAFRGAFEAEIPDGCGRNAGSKMRGLASGARLVMSAIAFGSPDLFDFLVATLFYPDK